MLISTCTRHYTTSLYFFHISGWSDMKSTSEEKLLGCTFVRFPDGATAGLSNASKTWIDFRMKGNPNKWHFCRRC